MKKLGYAAALFLAMGSAQATDLSFDLNDAEVRGNIAMPLTEANYYVIADVLYSEGSKIDDFDLDDQTMTLAGGFLLHQPLNEVLSFKFGGKAVAVNSEELDDTLVGLPLGGELQFTLETSQNIIYFNGYAFYAPDIISFGDMESYSEFGFEVEYPFSNQLSAYAGYRFINVNLDETQFGGADNLEVSSRPYIGVTFSF